MSRFVVCFSVLVCSRIEAANILAVFPTPSISHQVMFRPLTHELARRGHQIVVITTDPAFPKGQTPENLTEIDVHEASYEIWRQMVKNLEENVIKDDQSKNKNKYAFDSLLKIFEMQTAVPEVKDIIENKNNTFDLLLVEAWTRYALGFSHAVKVPVIAVSSLGAMLDNYDVMGAPIHPILYHRTFSTRLYNLSLWEKIQQY